MTNDDFIIKISIRAVWYEAIASARGSNCRTVSYPSYPGAGRNGDNLRGARVELFFGTVAFLTIVIGHWSFPGRTV